MFPVTKVKAKRICKSNSKPVDTQKIWIHDEEVFFFSSLQRETILRNYNLLILSLVSKVCRIPAPPLLVLWLLWLSPVVILPDNNINCLKGLVGRLNDWIFVKLLEQHLTCGKCLSQKLKTRSWGLVVSSPACNKMEVDTLS